MRILVEVDTNIATIDHCQGAVKMLAASPARCLRCAADLSTLPREGRYCPRCGLDSLSSAPAAIRAKAVDCALGHPSDQLGWAHLAELTICTKSPFPPIIAPAPSSSSQILRGYASALYKLGRRYELPIGRANPREAIRCYVKAARLGNIMAFARLATRWIERCDRVEASHPANMPPDMAVQADP